MANDLMFLSRQVLEHSHALLIARLKFQEARVAELEAALQRIADLHSQAMGRPDAAYVSVAKTMGETARDALPSKANEHVTKETDLEN